jgi:hypothetical protein
VPGSPPQFCAFVPDQPHAFLPAPRQVSCDRGVTARLHGWSRRPWEAMMLLKAAIALLVLWVAGLGYGIGQLVRVLLLVGLMLLLLSFAKGRDAATRCQGSGSDK